MKTEKDKLKCMVPINAPELDNLFKNKREADKARAILQHMFFILMRMKRNENFAPGVDRSTRYVPVSASNLKQIVRNYSSVIQQLIDHNIIEYKVNEDGNKSYLPGKYTMLYRITKDVLISTTKQKYRVEYITHSSVIGAIRRYYIRRYDRQLNTAIYKDPWLASSADFIDQIYLDITKEQIEQLESDGDIDIDFLLGFEGKFNNKISRFFVRDTFGNRLHTHVSNTPSLLRPYLRLKDSEDTLVMIDVKAAQPYLMSLIFYHNHLINLVEEFKPILPILQKHKNSPSVRLFLQDCTSGILYKGLMDISGLTKPELKTLLFNHVFYSSLFTYKSDLKIGPERLKTQELFSSKYRDVFKLLKELKRTPKSTLPSVNELSKSYSLPCIIAQRLESTIFLDGITRQCAEQDIPVATIHDAWILKRSDQNRFMEVFYDEFKLLAVNPPQVKPTDLVQH
jgi:hypothetical protein